jgi:hypothetical protein
MCSDIDWRDDNLKHLQGAAFRFAEYKAPTDDWDHDHCIGCWAKFADFDGPDILHVGYVHDRPYEPKPEPEFITQSREQGMRCIRAPLVKGCDLNWLCIRCFNDFRGRLGFTLEPSESST